MKKRSAKAATVAPLRILLDVESRRALTKAAELRRISLSDYVRTVAVPLARREVAAARSQTILLSPDEQLQFWEALSAPSTLSPAQVRLGGMIRDVR